MRNIDEISLGYLINNEQTIVYVIFLYFAKFYCQIYFIFTVFVVQASFATCNKTFITQSIFYIITYDLLQCFTVKHNKNTFLLLKWKSCYLYNSCYTKTLWMYWIISINCIIFYSIELIIWLCFLANKFVLRNIFNE